MKFKLVSDYKPTGDQPQAIESIVSGFEKGLSSQVLLGITGSGKTYSVANVIQNLQKPVLVVSHNKTLTAQLYQEFKEYFPQNAVSFFVSYYDYYQPESYIPQTDTYIAKEADINHEIDKLRLETTSQIFSRRDVIVVASVSCIYNIGPPEQYQNRVLPIKVGQYKKREEFLYPLVALYYQRSRIDFSRGFFRVRGDAVEIYPSYEDEVIKIVWREDRIVEITAKPIFGDRARKLDQYFLFPAKHYLADPDTLNKGFRQIREDLSIRLKELKKEKKILEVNRLSQRVNYDLEMIKEMGYVNGIENYSRYFDGRQPGDPPFCLVDYFRYQYGDDFLVVIDESHMTVPQIKGMYRGDLARKKTLIDFGFRLPSCLDNRPLRAEEFWARVPRGLFISATPSQWEVEKSRFRVVEQLIRPTGLVDPEVEIRPTQGQIKDLIKEVLKRKKKSERVLVTTLTKQMAEDLSAFLSDPEKTGEPISVHHLHADVGTMERTDILADLRRGRFDVIVGINLLREGLDLPEVSLVVILDADQRGFLRSKTSLIQTMGRAARNAAGKVILYADEETEAIRESVKEVSRRRQVQLEHNRRHHIIPKTIIKPIRDRIVPKKEKEEIDDTGLTPGEAKKLVGRLGREMRRFAKALEFEKAVEVRDRIESLKKEFDLQI